MAENSALWVKIPAVKMLMLTVKLCNLTGRKSMPANNVKIIRGHVMHTVANPFIKGDDAAFKSYPDGGVAINTNIGVVLFAGTFDEMALMFPNAEVIDRQGCYILPGLVDCHVHYPQTLMPAAYGEQLLEWLTTHTFPEEAKYADPEYAANAATLSFDEMIANGTTTANVFGVQFPEAMDIAFKVARERRFRAIMGLNLSDCNIPEALRLSPDQSYQQSARLIERWHGGKQLYAVTPRSSLQYAGNFCKISQVCICTHTWMKIWERSRGWRTSSSQVKVIWGCTIASGWSLRIRSLLIASTAMNKLFLGWHQQIAASPIAHRAICSWAAGLYR
jgi:hypothetical protein